jgi:hypothetical protein
MAYRRHITAAALSGALLLSPVADAAEITEVVDAFDTANDNPFDFHIEPSFRQVRERATIARESGCDDCGDAPTTEFRREMDYERVRSEMNFDLQLGLARDLEFHVRIPLIISDQRTLEYADGVNEDNSNVDPSNRRIADDLDPGVDDYYDGDVVGDDRTHFGTYRFFDLPNDGVKRSGLGDIVVGFAWAPWNDQRQPHAATMRFGVDYLAPTGKAASGDNTGVGGGAHELQISLAASRRVHEFVEPYFHFSFAQPFAAGSGPFSQDSRNSETQAPGGRLDIGTGTEIVLFEDEDSNQRYTFDLGFAFGYHLEGRDYTPLSDALARSNCNGLSAAEAGFPADPGSLGGADGNGYNPGADVLPEDAGCAWVVQQPGNAVDDSSSLRSDWTYAHNGVSDVEGHANVGGHTGFNLQVSKYIELRMAVDVRWVNAHLITVADSGRDGDGTDVVELDPAPNNDDAAERNPFYNLTLDSVGRRFRVENEVDITWGLTAAFQF